MSKQTSQASRAMNPTIEANRGMKTHFIVRAYILADSMGEWWESLNIFGDTRRFRPGTSHFSPTKEFKTAESAIATARNKFSRFQIQKLTPPVRPSIEWGQEIVFDSQTAQQEAA